MRASSASPAADPSAPTGSAASAATPVAAADRARVCIVIAAFQEASAIGAVVQGLRRAGWSRVVVVDDGSEDATSERAREAGAIVARHLINRGQGAALQTGIAVALRMGAPVIVTFDADGQHRVQDLDALVGPVLRGEVDAALGSRFLGHQDAIPVGRRLLLRAARLFTLLTSGVRLTDVHNGLRAISARMAAQIDLRMDRMAHASEIIDQITSMGLGWREVSVRIEYTDYSRAKGQRGSAALRVATDYLLGRLLG